MNNSVKQNSSATRKRIASLWSWYFRYINSYILISVTHKHQLKNNTNRNFNIIKIYGNLDTNDSIPLKELDLFAFSVTTNFNLRLPVEQHIVTCFLLFYDLMPLIHESLPCPSLRRIQYSPV